MKILFALCCLIAVSSGCTAAPRPVPVTLTPPLPLPPPQPAETPPALPTPVANVAEQYQHQAQKEISAVTAPDVTPQYIHSVRQADLVARQAVNALMKRPTQDALDKAREAVHALEQVLDGPS
jgi:hypothetical protein